MEFEEKASIIKISEFPNSMIYFLIQDNIVVYVGQTRNGISRPLSHKDKVFDTIAFVKCDEKDLDYQEAIYMQKYSPKYNSLLNTKVCKSMNWMKSKLRNDYGFKFQKMDIKRVADFVGAKFYYLLGTGYVYDYDFEKIVNFIEKNLDKFVSNNNTRSVIPIEVFK